MRYHRGNSRYQQSFLSIDDQISKSNVVHLIDDVCEQFCSTVTIDKGLKDTGRKAYHPADLTKILVYGYFNGIASSRKLEREVQRNIELKWLTSGVVPDHKTISDFRRDNPDLIDGLFKFLISRFREQGIATGKGIAIDGTKIKAYASKELDIDSIRQKLDGIEQQVDKYLKTIDAIDREEDNIEELVKQKAELVKELEALVTKKKAYQQQVQHLESAGEKKISVTDPDSKIMRGRGGKFWGYNAQAAVDAEHHIITSVKVTNNQNDKGLLTPMVESTEENTGEKVQEVLADAGYYKIDEIEQLEEEDIECFVVVNLTASQARDYDRGMFFKYISNEDQYICSEGKPLKYANNKTGSNGKKLKVYRGIQCESCRVHEQCTKAKRRSVHRNENQEYIDAFIKKMTSPEGKAKAKKRKTVSEHPFGTIKHSMGQVPLLLRGSKKVQTEINLYAIGYNLKRYLSLRGPKKGGPTKTKRRTQAKNN